MSVGVTIGNRFIRWEDLKNFRGQTQQEINAADFILQWLNGRDEFLINSSGSTGKPSTLRILRDQMEYSAKATLAYFSLSSSDHAFVCMNTAFIAGKMMLVRALIAGMDLTISEPGRLPELTRGEYTFTALAPLQLSEVVKAGHDLSLYKCILVGGAPVNRELLNSLSEGNFNVYETYGMTETVSHIAVKKITGPSENPFRCIQPLKIETDERGCLRVNGKITQHEWLQTNDRVEITGIDTFVWVGRADWTINSGGIKIQPEMLENTIENLLVEDNFDNQIMITGYPHPELGECVVLLIEGFCDKDEETIISILKSKLDRYQVPKKVIFIPEFKRTPTSKIDRRATSGLLPLLTF